MTLSKEDAHNLKCFDPNCERVSCTDRREMLDKISKLERKLDEINTPEINDFIAAVELEAKHQRIRWGTEHDGGKTDADWFWLIGYLAGKALHKPEKQLHHIITTAAACLNWHAAKAGVSNSMRPGIAEPAAERATDRGSE